MRWIPASRGERVAFLTLLGVVVLLAVVPVGRLAQEALAPGGKIDPALLVGVLENPAVWRATRNTLTVSLGGVVLAVAFGGAFALLVTLTDLRGKKPLVFCFMLPLMIAPQVTALAWIDRPEHPSVARADGAVCRPLAVDRTVPLRRLARVRRQSRSGQPVSRLGRVF